MNRGDNRDDVGLSCNLAALDEAQRKRRALLAEWLQVGTVDISDVPDGYEFHYYASHWSAIDDIE